MISFGKLRAFMGPIPVWFGDKESAVLVDVWSGGVYGHYWHDGYGKWFVEVRLNHWRAWRTLKTHPAWFGALASWSHRWVHLVRSKSREGAIAAIEDFLPTIMVTIERDKPEDLDGDSWGTERRTPELTDAA